MRRARLRNETDLGRLNRDLVKVVDETLQSQPSVRALPSDEGVRRRAARQRIARVALAGDGQVGEQRDRLARI